MALVPASTVPRRLNGVCVSNFYPIHFKPSGDGHLHIKIFHCYFHDVDADEPIRPREETELKRRIFEAPRLEGRQRAVEDALGVRCLEFGGDCAAGLRNDVEHRSLPGAGAGGAGRSAGEQTPGRMELVLDDVDRYEAYHGGDWLPAVIRAVLDDDNVEVELYAPGSFWSENLNRTGPFVLLSESLRPRRWEVFRGEVLRIPENEVLTLHPGQHMWVRPRGPGQEEPAGRLSASVGAGVRCEGGTVENEGTLECMVALQHPQHGIRRYKVEIESVKTLLVECLEGVPDLPIEERSVVLQCFTWVFERAYRNMQMRTLGGRGWYLLEEGETYPRQPPESDRMVPPRVFLYRGFAATAVQVAHGPCLKVDLSVRMIQGQTALVKLNFFRDLLIHQHRTRGWPAPTKTETEEFLQTQMVGRTCMTRHNHIHYRINRVCIDMDPMTTFPFEDDQISYMEYFQRRHGITLQRRQPLLHCPFRGKQELYLPAELAFLTGLDEDWKSDREFAQELWRGLRHNPTSHWLLQSRLSTGLASEDGAALREWGVEVEREPLKVPCGELEHEPVYYSPIVEEYFRRAKLPQPEWEVPTSRMGFDAKPWPEVWLPRGQRLVIDRWLVFCSTRAEEREVVENFIKELEPLVGELIEADNGEGRIVIAPPHVVEVRGNTAEEWASFIRAYEAPWPGHETKFVLVAIPDKVRRRDQYYYQLKDLLSFQQANGVLTQMVLTATLQRANQRQQIWCNILQQMLVKRGAWLWVISPLPYRGRIVMVVGMDACRQSKDFPAIRTLCASTNPYFTSYYTTWRTQRGDRAAGGGEQLLPPGELLKEAVLNFYEVNRRLPDTLVIYRGGVSESQEAALLDGEVYHPEHGLLQALVAISEEVTTDEETLDQWKARVELAYILVRRGTNARFRTERYENLPSGTYIDQSIVVNRTEAPKEEGDRFDFYMVSQTYVIGTAKPTLYSVLHSTLSLSRYEIIQLTYRLCGVYMTFSGMVSMPAPMKYSAKLLSLLAKCSNAPSEPTGASLEWRNFLFFV